MNVFRPRTFPVLAAFLFLAGCSGGNGDGGIPSPATDATPASAAEATESATRREFVVLRELVKQHGLQKGNAVRREAVERALKEMFPQLPDEGRTEEEKRVFRQAAELIESIGRKDGLSIKD